MNLDALWTLDYATNHGDFGNGVAVLVAGKIYGGDMNHYYQGEYQADDEGAIEGKVTMHLHPGRAVPVCAEVDQFTVVFSGQPVDGELEIHGVLEHEPTTKFFIHMGRQSSVPVFQDSGVNPYGDYRDRAIETCLNDDSEFGEHGYMLQDDVEKQGAL